MTTGPGDGPAAAGRGRLRAGHADREQVIDTVKAAFVQGMLTKAELDVRLGQTFAARTCGELAALTADLPAGLAAAGPAHPPVRVRRRPLAKAAAGSGTCLALAAAAVWAAGILDPGPPAPSPDHHWVSLMFIVALAAIVTAFGILANGISTSLEQRRSRRQLPPRPGPGGQALDAGRPSDTGNGPVPPGPGDGQARTDLRAHKPPQRLAARTGRPPRGVRPARRAPVPRAT